MTNIRKPLQYFRLNIVIFLLFNNLQLYHSFLNSGKEHNFVFKKTDWLPSFLKLKAISFVAETETVN